MTPSSEQPASPPRLALGDSPAELASDEQPESWGDLVESDGELVAWYEGQRPPHHGD